MFEISNKKIYISIIIVCLIILIFISVPSIKFGAIPFLLIIMGISLFGIYFNKVVITPALKDLYNYSTLSIDFANIIKDEKIEPIDFIEAKKLERAKKLSDELYEFNNLILSQ